MGILRFQPPTCSTYRFKPDQLILTVTESYLAETGVFMFSDSQGLPFIRLVTSNSQVSRPASSPTDLRWLRVEEYFQARSLADNTQKAYRRELK